MMESFTHSRYPLNPRKIFTTAKQLPSYGGSVETRGISPTMWAKST